MASKNSDNAEVRLGAPGNVLEVRVGTVEVDISRASRVFRRCGRGGGTGAGRADAGFDHRRGAGVQGADQSGIAQNDARNRRVLEGAVKPVGSDAEGVIELTDQQRSAQEVASGRPER